MIEEIRNLLASHYTWFFSGLGTTLLLLPFHLRNLIQKGKEMPEFDQVTNGLFSVAISKKNLLGQLNRGVMSATIGFHVGNQYSLFSVVSIAHTVGYPNKQLSRKDYVDFLIMCKNTGRGLIIASPIELAISFFIWHLGYNTRFNFLLLLLVTFLFLHSLALCLHGTILYFLGRKQG